MVLILFIYLFYLCPDFYLRLLLNMWLNKFPDVRWFLSVNFYFNEIWILNEFSWKIVPFRWTGVTKSCIKIGKPTSSRKSHYFSKIRLDWRVKKFVKIAIWWNYEKNLVDNWFNSKCILCWENCLEISFLHDYFII